jgi:phosphoglycolate phosphatase-like HAD superfamily hydrolase
LVAIVSTSSRLFLFDIDGTLLWPRGAGRAAMRIAIEDVFGVNAATEAHIFGGKTDWQTLVELLTPLGFDETAIERTMPEFDRVIGRHLAQRISEFDVEACPGAHDLIAMLRQRDDARLGLITGNCRSSAPLKLRAAGFDPDHFPVGAFGSESRDRDALAPLALARAETHYGCAFDPQQVIVIGDTAADVRCARAIGALAVTVRTGYTLPGELEASAPDLIVDDLRALLPP